MSQKTLGAYTGQPVTAYIRDPYVRKEIQRITGTGNSSTLGPYVTFEDLQADNPTATVGSYAIVDSGSGSPAQLYIWDEDEGWIASGGSAPFTALVGATWDGTNKYTTLSGNTTLILDSEQEAGILYVVNGASHTLSVNGQALTINNSGTNGGRSGIAYLKINGNYVLFVDLSPVLAGSYTTTTTTTTAAPTTTTTTTAAPSTTTTTTTVGTTTTTTTAGVGPTFAPLVLSPTTLTESPSEVWTAAATLAAWEDFGRSALGATGEFYLMYRRVPSVANVHAIGIYAVSSYAYYYGMLACVHYNGSVLYGLSGSNTDTLTVVANRYYGLYRDSNDDIWTVYSDDLVTFTKQNPGTPLVNHPGTVYPVVNVFSSAGNGISYPIMNGFA